MTFGKDLTLATSLGATSLRDKVDLSKCTLLSSSSLFSSYHRLALPCLFLSTLCNSASSFFARKHIFLTLPWGKKLNMKQRCDVITLWSQSQSCLGNSIHPISSSTYPPTRVTWLLVPTPAICYTLNKLPVYHWAIERQTNKKNHTPTLTDSPNTCT